MTRRVGAPGRSRALRYGALTAAAALLVSLVLALAAGATLTSAQDRLRAATERSVGTITAVDGDRVLLEWTPTDGAARADPVALAGTGPPAGTRVEVAYDPDEPSQPLVPGAALLADADRALSTLVLAGTVAALVVAASGWQLLSRRRAAGGRPRTVPARRVRVQSALMSRSWLETETTPPQWIPVHFDPVLVTLPAPAEVTLHGDPRRDRLVAARIDGRLLYPSGPVRSTEPTGDRTDNAVRPGSDAPQRAMALAGLPRQVSADLPLLVPAPLIAALWTYVDGGGFGTWLAATLLLAVLALFYAAIRGSDPT